jgi:hypothetical protein
MSAQFTSQWPRIRQFLHADNPTSSVGDDYLSFLRTEDRLDPAERAAAYEEWADFYEWRLARRAGELATDRVKRYLAAEWTESMTYSCRRSAAFARGEDPGPCVPLSTRRPDLAEERLAITAETVANLEPRTQLAKAG